MSVVSLVPNYALAIDHADIAARVRDMADRIEAGEFPDLARVLFVLDGDKTEYRVYGQQTSKAYIVGLLEYAKQAVINGA